ncbi:hypothetical protein FHT87_000007 [Rhizobium sp. BK316]|nr:hypothetical protein [Rhizobium sp. BK316]
MFQSIAQERYLLAVPRDGRFSLKTEIDIEDLRAEKISIASDLPADFS